METFNVLMLLVSAVFTVIELVVTIRYLMRHPKGGAGFLLRSGLAMLVYAVTAMLPVVIVIMTLPPGGRSETEALLITLGILAWIMLVALWLARMAPLLGDVAIPGWIARSWSWPDAILIGVLLLAVVGLIYQT